MSTVAVPGATLYYQVAGTGPVLLFIHGGGGDTEDFADVTELLVDAFTVVRYDCRGNSRSHLTGQPQPVSIPTQVEDARHVLRAIGAGPVYVVGSSAGAQIGLALTAQHPRLVLALVAHEPPVVMLLPDTDPRRPALLDVGDICRQQGLQAAIQARNATCGFDFGASTSDNDFESPRAQARMADKQAGSAHNGEYFLRYVHDQIARYQPDLDALRSPAMPPITVGVGQASTGQLAHDTGRSLAEQLGRPPVIFPGGHAGYLTHPTAFAATLRSTLNRVD